MKPPAIEIRGLRKRYGDALALDGVDLSVSEGSVFGFLGPNGAGKTTTLRILTGLARADAGDARILGEPVGSAAVRRMVGFLPDVPGFYAWMTAPEYLRFIGGLFGLADRDLDSRAHMLLEMAGLAGVKTRIGGYSRGMKQRLGVAQALMNAPRLLMLDEPTSALDPLGRKEVLEMIAALGGRTTVFFSTHILADAERVCDTVAILAHGRVVAQASMAELKTRHGAYGLALAVEGDSHPFVQELREAPWVSSVGTADGNEMRLTVTDLGVARRAVPEMVARYGLGLRTFETTELGLEEVFVELVGGGR